jgi:hypothetical protein
MNVGVGFRTDLNLEISDHLGSYLFHIEDYLIMVGAIHGHGIFACMFLWVGKLYVPMGVTHWFPYILSLFMHCQESSLKGHWSQVKGLPLLS